MNLDELVQQLDKLNDKIDQANTVVKDLSQAKAKLLRDLQDAMTQVGVADFKAHGLHIKLEVAESPKATNWDDLYGYIITNNRPWLLHKRLSSTALKELRDSGEQVPGIEWTQYADVSVTKAKR